MLQGLTPIRICWQNGELLKLERDSMTYAPSSMLHESSYSFELCHLVCYVSLHSKNFHFVLCSFWSSMLVLCVCFICFILVVRAVHGSSRLEFGPNLDSNGMGPFMTICMIVGIGPFMTISNGTLHAYIGIKLGLNMIVFSENSKLTFGFGEGNCINIA